jgi:hypothetical protein
LEWVNCGIDLEIQAESKILRFNASQIESCKVLFEYDIRYYNYRSKNFKEHMKTKDLIAEISDLPVEQRMRIADQILQTLNRPDPDIESAWIEEVEKRVESYEKGGVDLVPAREVFKTLRDITEE